MVPLCFLPQGAGAGGGRLCVRACGRGGLPSTMPCHRWDILLPLWSPAMGPSKWLPCLCLVSTQGQFRLVSSRCLPTRRSVAPQFLRTTGKSLACPSQEPGTRLLPSRHALPEELCVPVSCLVPSRPRRHFCSDPQWDMIPMSPVGIEGLVVCPGSAWGLGERFSASSRSLNLLRVSVVFPHSISAWGGIGHRVLLQAPWSPLQPLPP